METRVPVTLCLLVLGTASWLPGAESEENSPMHIVEDEKRILVKRGEQTVLRYNKAPTDEAAKHEPHFSRSGYIHPIYTPSGQVVTGDYARDHKHQHGLFFAWTKTEFEGREPEFWNQKLEAGRISYRVNGRTKKRLASGEEGRSMCVFTVKHLWEDRTAPDGAKPVLEEAWTVTTYDAGPERFVFDIESRQYLVADQPLTIRKYHYGGMAIRGTADWLSTAEAAEPPGAMLTSEGLGRKEGNHSRPRWVAMHGPVEDGHAGVAVLSHPGNFRAPQWVRLHPSKPYFVWAPMVEEPFRITPGQPYVSRYRYVVFDGEPVPAGLDEEWNALESDFSPFEPAE